MKKIIISLVFLFIIFIFLEKVDARSGCCSWHGGVCGCSPGGSQECCDGTLSPSCTCTPIATQNNTNYNALDSLGYKTDYCGAGEHFTSSSAAEESLNDYQDKIEEPLNYEIQELKEEANILNNKYKIAFFVSILLFIISVTFANFVDIDLEQEKWIKLWLKICRIALYIIFYGVIFGFLLYFEITSN